MKWYWYVAQPDELLIDLDGRILLEIFQKRLLRSNLPYEKIFVIPSTNPEHFHVAIKLKKWMTGIERQVWQLYFLDHVYRSVNNLFRVINQVPAPSLLISPEDWSKRFRFPKENKFWRFPDAVCNCKAKHSTRLSMAKCKAAVKLRGRYADWSPF